MGWVWRVCIDVTPGNLGNCLESKRDKQQVIIIIIIIKNSVFYVPSAKRGEYTRITDTIIITVILPTSIIYNSQ